MVHRPSLVCLLFSDRYSWSIPPEHGFSPGRLARKGSTTWTCKAALRLKKRLLRAGNRRFPIPRRPVLSPRSLSETWRAGQQPVQAIGSRPLHAGSDKRTRQPVEVTAALNSGRRSGSALWDRLQSVEPILRSVKRPPPAGKKTPHARSGHRLQTEAGWHQATAATAKVVRRMTWGDRPVSRAAAKYGRLSPMSHRPRGDIVT